MKSFYVTDQHLRFLVSAETKEEALEKLSRFFEKKKFQANLANITLGNVRLEMPYLTDEIICLSVAHPIWPNEPIEVPLEGKNTHSLSMRGFKLEIEYYSAVEATETAKIIKRNLDKYTDNVSS